MGSRSGFGPPEQVESVEIIDPTFASGDRPRRGPSPRSLLVVAAVLVLFAAAVGIAGNGSGDAGDDERVDTFAPDVTVGEASLVVMATTFDAHGARALIPASVVTSLGTVPGVRAAEGVLRTNVAVRDANGQTLGNGQSTVALSWNGTAGLQLREGRPPATSGEIAVDVGTLAEHDLLVGDEVRVDPYGAGPQAHVNDSGLPTTGGVEATTIVGSFSVAGDDAGVPGVALTAFDAVTLLSLSPRGPEPGFDRVDLIAGDGVDSADLLSRVASALPPGTQVVPASELGNREQLRAELEIQRAFFDLLSRDVATRTAAVEGADQAAPEVRAQGIATFQRYLSQLVNVEFRVQRVNFLDADHASLVFMTYYGSQPSPVLTQPFDAHAVRIDGRWKISSSTVCTLTLLGGAPCVPQPGQAIEPPPGWELPATQPEVTAVFTRASTPGATVVVSGVRLVDANRAEVFYSVTAPDQPHLETPYPLVARAIRADGVWQPEAPVLEP
jgi:hypothetical protein